MCLHIDEKHAVVKTADKDIMVYKVIQCNRAGEHHAIFKCFIYDLTDVMVADHFEETVKRVGSFRKYYDYVMRLSYGFHSYVRQDDAFILLSRCLTNNYRTGWYGDVDLRLAKFVVPKDTRYINGVNDDNHLNILSEKLKFVKFED